MNKLKAKTVKFVPIRELVNPAWNNWFFSLLSEDAPFSWGDNNFTLISAGRFKKYVTHILYDGKSAGAAELMETLTYLEQDDVYINLED
jgi:hypothetical protein